MLTLIVDLLRFFGTLFIQNEEIYVCNTMIEKIIKLTFLHIPLWFRV